MAGVDGIILGPTPSAKGDADAQEIEHKITAKWVGGLIRRRLGLHTVRLGGVYIIPSSELLRIEQLYGKYGLVGESAIGTPPPDLPF